MYSKAVFQISKVPTALFSYGSGYTDPFKMPKKLRFFP
jgi:hypothetical protein